MNTPLSFNELINSEKPVLVDFYAQWCGPCKMMPPILKETKTHFGDTIHIIQIDIDKNQHTANKFAIRSVPTLMLFKNGQVLWKQSGVTSSSQLISILKNQLNNE